MPVKKIIRNGTHSQPVMGCLENKISFYLGTFFSTSIFIGETKIPLKCFDIGLREYGDDTYLRL